MIDYKNLQLGTFINVSDMDKLKVIAFESGLPVLMSMKDKNDITLGNNEFFKKWESILTVNFSDLGYDKNASEYPLLVERLKDEHFDYSQRNRIIDAVMDICKECWAADADCRCWDDS